MRTAIASPAVSQGGWRRRHSARRLADDAARTCLDAAGRSAGDVGLLLNVGIYRDGDLGEPALAALIQEDVGANPEDPQDGEPGTFSFDVANGACGVLTALQVADGFLRAGTIERALIVASDADPGHHLAVDFPFAPSGGALLVERTPGEGGFTGFRWATLPDTADLFRATLSLSDDGTNRMHVDVSTSFADVAVRGAAGVAADLLREHSLEPADVDLVVVNPIGAGCARTFAGMLGVDGRRVACAESDPPPHTAGLIASLAAAQADGRLAAAHRVLLVSAGAGVTVGAALLAV